MTTTKKLLIAFGIIIVIGLILFFIFRGSGKAPQYKTVPVTMGSIRSIVTATGTVNPVVTVNVGTQVSGTIKRIYADYNSVVKKGQLIAEIDPSTFQAQVNQARANLMAAKANVLKAQAMLNDSKRTLERNRQLIAKDLIARSDFDTSEASWQANDAQVKAAQAAVAQTQAALDYAETNLRYTKILSPVDGTVVSRSVDVGQTVAASFQTPTLFNIAQDLTKMQIDASVDEADIGKIKVDQDVEFSVDAYPEVSFGGKVSQVRISPTTVSNVVTYDVVVLVDNKDIKLKPGMTANVSLITSVRDGVLRLPNAALRFKPEMEKTKTVKGAPKKMGPSVWVLDENKPKRLSITTGISDGIYTEVTSGDIKEGLEVITESLVVAKKDGGTASSPFMPSRPPR